MNKIIDVTNHVRYTIALMRVDGSGKHYAAMKTSIEVADSLVKERVVDIITRAIRRELPHENDSEELIKDVLAVVLAWFAVLKVGYGPVWQSHGNVTLFGHDVITSYGDGFISSANKKQYIQTSIFTKEDEERVEALFPNS